MAKPKARLENWVYGRRLGKLSGNVYDHPRFGDGEPIISSPVLSPPDQIKEGNEVETRNTIYKLGKEESRK